VVAAAVTTGGEVTLVVAAAVVPKQCQLLVCKLQIYCIQSPKSPICRFNFLPVVTTPVPVVASVVTAAVTTGGDVTPTSY
jgi:hypothetical protein